MSFTSLEARKDQHPLLRLFLLGPFTGGCVGFAQTTAVFLCWLWHGRPDFYFRGWSEVQLHYASLIIGGGVVGIGYGVILWSFERLSRRSIRMLTAIPAVVSIAFAVAAAVAAWEFRHRRIERHLLLPQLAAVVIGVGISARVSRPAP